MSAISVLVLIVLLTTIAAAMYLIAPLLREAVVDRQVRRVREQQAQTEARLRLLTQFTIQRMHQAARQQSPDDES